MVSILGGAVFECHQCGILSQVIACCGLLQKTQKKQALGWSVEGRVFIIKRIFYPRSASLPAPITLLVWGWLLSTQMPPVF
jgi:hypothetical protein